MYKNPTGFAVLAASLTVLACAGTPTAAHAADLLGSAASFAVLAGSTITNTGASAVTGDLGIWPGTAVTGFPPGIVGGGATHAGDAVAAQAQSDLTAAYETLRTLSASRDMTGQDLGGLTLSGGVYHFDTTAQLTGGLFLDAAGDATTVFVFQIGSTLTTASRASVTIINGGSAENVYWQVGDSAILGANTAFRGSILALTSITLTTGAGLEDGRILARNGVVTLDHNRVTAPRAASNQDSAAAPEPTSAALFLGVGLPLVGVFAYRRARKQR